jgi:hypothetical protein
VLRETSQKLHGYFPNSSSLFPVTESWRARWCGREQNKGHNELQSLSRTGQSWVIKPKLYLWEVFWVGLGFKLRASEFLGRPSTLYKLSNSASIFCKGI